MDSLIFEMEKLLASGREDCDIQDIIGKKKNNNNIYIYIIWNELWL